MGDRNFQGINISVRDVRLYKWEPTGVGFLGQATQMADPSAETGFLRCSFFGWVLLEGTVLEGSEEGKSREVVDRHKKRGQKARCGKRIVEPLTFQIC